MGCGGVKTSNLLISTFFAAVQGEKDGHARHDDKDEAETVQTRVRNLLLIYSFIDLLIMLILVTGISLSCSDS